VLELIPTALANEVVSAELAGGQQETFPLDLILCNKCSHLQLKHLVDPARLFRDYVYVSGTSTVFVSHFKQLAGVVGKMVRTSGRNPRALEIGSNDGTLLRALLDEGFDVLGIDPAESIATAASNSGIPTRVAFFDESYARELAEQVPPFDAVVANNVLAHAGQLSDIFRGIARLLTPDGFVVFEVSYLGDVVVDNLFDTIYHEHTSYHALAPLVENLPEHGLAVFDVERVTTHGGSIRVFAQSVKSGKRVVESSVAEMLRDEQGLALASSKTYAELAARITQLRVEFQGLIADLDGDGVKLGGFGAPAKATTLCYQLGVNSKNFQYVIDDNPMKQGKFTPGLHIPIRGRDALELEPVDCLVVFAWNFVDSIVASNKTFTGNGGKFVVPVPKLQILS